MSSLPPLPYHSLDDLDVSPRSDSTPEPGRTCATWPRTGAPTPARGPSSKTQNWPWCGGVLRANSIHPTSVDTDMIHNLDMYALLMPGVEHPTRELSAPVFESLNALPIPWAEPRDISNAVIFLASDEARYITGVALPVDAGSIIQ